LLASTEHTVHFGGLFTTRDMAAWRWTIDRSNTTRKSLKISTVTDNRCQELREKNRTRFLLTKTIKIKEAELFRAKEQS
jgi:hypothetical protein